MQRALPFKRVRELQQRFQRLSEAKQLSCTFMNVIDGETITVGGEWDSVAGQYSTIAETSETVFKLGKSQFLALQYAVEAIFNDEKMNRNEPPITTILIHAARRGGKSYALAAIFLMMMLARPGITCWLVGLKIEHGKNIIDIMRGFLYYKNYVYDNRHAKITLQNGASFTARSEINHNRDRGSKVHVLGLDEAAFMEQHVYDSAVPAITDCNGVALLASSPHGYNYFQRIAESADSPDPISGKVIKVVFLDPVDNVFVPHLHKMRQYMRYTMSPEAYEQEQEGKFIAKTGKVMPHFDRNQHVVVRHQIEDDTARACGEMFSNVTGCNYVIGVDYNVNPTAGVICKFDVKGHVWYIAEVLSSAGTEVWGELLYTKLLELGATDPYQEALIIGDASGEYQDPRRKDLQSAKILRQQGWTVISPQARKKDNPSVLTRMEVIRSLHYNAAGEIRMHVDPECAVLIRCFNELPLNKQGKPDKAHTLNHIFDAASYPVYRIWGTASGERAWCKQLVTVNTHDSEL